MLGRRQSGRVSLSATSLQTLLDGIASRLDETRETSRYLIGLLVFLGLLGTFYGLLETVRSVGGVIGALDVTASDVARAFADLKAGLESPLHGMATAFSSSLFGLAGSLVLGFLDLQAGQAQNRFYNDLEEWLSTHTRLSSGSLAEAGEGSVPAYLQALLEQTADSLESLQRLLTRSEENRIASNTTLASLAERLGTIGEHMNAGQGQMIRFAESSLGQNEAVRTHLRAIEGYMARLNEELAELQQQVNELSDLLAVEKRTGAELREGAASLTTQLQAAIAERDTLRTRLGEPAARADQETARANEATGKLRDAEATVTADKEKVELQLKELESLRRDIEALKTVRAELEAKVAALAAGQQNT